MSIKEQLMADIKSAMKNKESDKLATLRFLHSAIKNKEIEVRPKELTEDDVLSVIKKMVKQRKDSIEQYEGAGRQDLADKEKAELVFMNTYLPEQLSEEKVLSIVKETITELGAKDMKDMGKVMQAVLTKTGGAADNKVVSQLVKQSLN
ncbi:MAG: GatB/YqeY domain-containing protein [Bdellovibrionales bacterium]|nr:GatB/YqeY domain-containing protein [Bdellovibrionales bacterium]